MQRKKKGKKRHILVDTLGLLLSFSITSADVQDQKEGKGLLAQFHEQYPTVTKVWADRAYEREGLPAYASSKLNLDLEITSKPSHQPGFIPLRQRWKSERTFGWLGKYRRLGRDVERTIASSKGFVWVSLINLMTHRLHPEPTK